MKSGTVVFIVTRDCVCLDATKTFDSQVSRVLLAMCYGEVGHFVMVKK